MHLFSAFSESADLIGSAFNQLHGRQMLEARHKDSQKHVVGHGPIIMMGRR